eukprot:jgi/Picsp_1/4613/NSC_01983-R1_af385707_1 at5g48790 k24g6_12
MEWQVGGNLCSSRTRYQQGTSRFIKSQNAYLTSFSSLSSRRWDARPLTARAQPGDVDISVSNLVGFPTDYVVAVKQAQKATKSALEDGKRLIEIEFPTSQLSAVAGDAEGAFEMTVSSNYLRQFTRMFMEEAEVTRIFFPDDKELEMQRSENGTWEATKFQLDYLTKPSGFLDIGVDISNYDPVSHINETDECFIVAYPSFDPRELVAADKVWQFAKVGYEKTGTQKPVIFFNAELDRLRSNYYPGIFYPNMARLSRDMIPHVESVYYIHNFKGSQGGILFRAYPGPWQVLLRLQDGGTKVVHVQDDRPTLKSVALDILPNAARKHVMRESKRA